MLRVRKIESLELPELQPYRTMRRQEEHRRAGIFVAEGEKVVRRLIESNLAVVSALFPQKWLDELRPLLEKRSEPIEVFVAVKALLEDPSRRAKGGSILNISSQMGHVGAAGRTAYCMSKHGLEGFSKALALELAPFGIRANTIAPTFADTPLVRRIVGDPAEQASTASRIPLGRLCRVEEIAAAALFLASDLAGSITGTHLLIYGGWTAQ